MTMNFLFIGAAVCAAAGIGRYGFRPQDREKLRAMLRARRREEEFQKMEGDALRRSQIMSESDTSAFTMMNESNFNDSEATWESAPDKHSGAYVSGTEKSSSVRSKKISGTDKSSSVRASKQISGTDKSSTVRASKQISGTDKSSTVRASKKNSSSEKSSTVRASKKNSSSEKSFTVRSPKKTSSSEKSSSVKASKKISNTEKSSSRTTDRLQ